MEKKVTQLLDSKGDANKQALIDSILAKQEAKQKKRLQEQEEKLAKRQLEASEKKKAAAREKYHGCESAKEYRESGLKRIHEGPTNAEIIEEQRLIDMQRVHSPTKAKIYHLMRNAGVDLKVSLTKRDTNDLLAMLMTCSEYNLHSMLDSPELPISFKIVIKSLINASKQGDISLVEKLWDRLFESAGEQQSNSVINNFLITNSGQNSGGSKHISRTNAAIMYKELYGKNIEEVESVLLNE